MKINETIAAVSTPYGRGGIAVIRISGERAVEIADKVFIPKSGKALSAHADRSALYGDILCDGRVTDDGIAVIYRAPRSYTGEDTVEISCHGGILLTEKVLSSVFEAGAVPASAGEFTRRAFVNGRIELSRAEAVIGLIDAESESQIKLFASHSSGVLGRKIDSYCATLRNLLSSVYVCIDYPEEDLEELGRDELAARLSSLLAELEATRDTYREGKAVSLGVDTVILGKPNAGKSSLLNRLLGEDRAIVTDIAGTTRDTIEEKLTLGRIMLRLCDTAGIRQTEDEIERIGVLRALERAHGAELIFAVFDGSCELDREDRELALLSLRLLSEGKNVVFVINKADMPQKFGVNELFSLAFGSESAPLEYADRIKSVSVSARSGDGIDALKGAVESLFVSGNIDYSNVAVIASARQHAAVSAAADAVKRAQSALSLGFGTDVCGLDMEQALSLLGEIDGRTVSEQITDEIFHRFCVGK